MNKKQKEKFELRANVFKALGHPTRLYIVHQLFGKERCVCELTEMIGDDISTVSKHLGVLKKAGIVSDDKRGQQVWYTLKVPCIVNSFNCVEDVLSSNGRKSRAYNNDFNIQA